jgi:GntR family transcriptional regulator
VAWDDEDLIEGPIPRWYQLAQRLHTALDKGEFTAGDRLPSEAQLNRRFGTSRTTSRAALDHLEQLGLVERGSGRGTIVRPPTVVQPLNALTSFGEDMRARGLTPGYGAAHVEIAAAGLDVATALGVAGGTKVITIQRLLVADGEPIASSRSWLSPHMVTPTAATLAELRPLTSLYRWLEGQRGVSIARGSEQISASIADPNLADDLNIAVGAPVLVAWRTALTAEGTPVEHVCRRYRADRYRYRLEVQRP